ncbi:MAG: hypothetical protein ACRD36_10305, partial [Candidatus Acidiferrum sp.]
MRIVHNASAVAAKRGLGYAKAEDRRELFNMEYPLVIGKEPVKPDLFLTGTVILDAKNHKTSVQLISFDAKTWKPREVRGAGFSVDTERSLLADAGRQFVLERALVKRATPVPDKDEPPEEVVKKDEKAKDDKAVDDAVARADAEPSTSSPPSNGIKPASLAPSTVKLEVLYNNQVVPLESDKQNPGGSGFSIPDPKLGDRVAFRITNTNEERVAVALLVNGVNTINEQLEDPALCTKWIIDGKQSLIVDGYYVGRTGEQNVKPFTVLPDKDSEEYFTRGSSDLADERLGTISMNVFLASDAKTQMAGDKAVSRGLAPARFKSESAKLDSYMELRKKLLESRSTATNRGLIAPDGSLKDGSKLKPEEFTNPNQKEHIFIRYFQPATK